MINCYIMAGGEIHLSKLLESVENASNLQPGRDFHPIVAEKIPILSATYQVERVDEVDNRPVAILAVRIAGNRKRSKRIVISADSKVLTYPEI